MPPDIPSEVDDPRHSIGTELGQVHPPGSAVTRAVTCGNRPLPVSCRSRAAARGPTLQWLRTVKGRTGQQADHREQLETCQPRIDNERRLCELSQQLERLTLEAMRNR
jgi:hypothetical protein